MAANEKNHIILKDLSYQIVAAAFEVHNTLGHGFLEKVYEKAFLKELELRGIKAESQKEIAVRYKGETIGFYYADVLVEDSVVVELKALDRLTFQHQAQVINYLKGTGKKLGLLINFGGQKVEYKRVVF
jgi:GxxExxY protein